MLMFNNQLYIQKLPLISSKASEVRNLYTYLGKDVARKKFQGGKSKILSGKSKISSEKSKISGGESIF